MGIKSFGTDAATTFLAQPLWQEIAHRLQLSRREAEITWLLLQDDHEASIAGKLAISRHTVHTHVERVYRKLAVSSRTQVAMRVFEIYVELHRGEGQPLA